MELILPSTLTITLSAVVLLGGLVWGAAKAFLTLKSKIDHIGSEVDGMIERNRKADRETEAVKAEQSEQRLSVALMAQQMANYGETLVQMNKKLDSLIDYNMNHNNRSTDRSH